MKKVFLSLLAATAIFSFVSCQSQSVEDKTIEYADKMLKARNEGNRETEQRVFNEFSEWVKSLSEADQYKALAVIDKWEQDNYDRLR